MSHYFPSGQQPKINVEDLSSALNTIYQPPLVVADSGESVTNDLSSSLEYTQNKRQFVTVGSSSQDSNESSQERHLQTLPDLRANPVHVAQNGKHLQLVINRTNSKVLPVKSRNIGAPKSMTS